MNAMLNRHDAMCLHFCLEVSSCAPWLLIQVVQQQMMQQASLHSAELTQLKSELQQAKSAHASAQASACQLQVEHQVEIVQLLTYG